MSNEYCTSGVCPPAKPFCYMGKCNQTCPEYTYIFNNTLCVDSCCDQLGTYQYFSLGQKCVDSCPWNYVSDNNCCCILANDLVGSIIALSILLAMSLSLCLFVFLRRETIPNITHQKSPRDGQSTDHCSEENSRLLDDDELQSIVQS